MTGYRIEDDRPFSKKYAKVDVDVDVNVSAKEKKGLPGSTDVLTAGLPKKFYEAKEIVVDGVVVKSRFFPAGMGVLVVPQPEDRLARCQHNNFAGECLVCYRMDKGEHP